MSTPSSAVAKFISKYNQDLCIIGAAFSLAFGVYMTNIYDGVDDSRKANVAASLEKHQDKI